MKVAKDKVVSFHYTLTLDSGDVLDTSLERDPLNFIVGHQQIVPGLEQALLGMGVGDKKAVTVKPADAYGDRDETMIMSVSRDRIPADVDLYEGLVLSGKNEDGMAIEGFVKSFDEKDVVIDFNHPLAGKILQFDTKIVDIREATSEELEHGHVH